MHRQIKLSRALDPDNMEIDLAVHPADSNIIIINYAGFGEDLNGHNRRYEKLANLMQERGLGSIVRMGNMDHQGLNNQETMNDNLRFVVDYCLAKDTKNSKLYLMGFSAGASSIAAVVGDYPRLEKILLMAPSSDAGIANMERELKRYSGEAYFATGENDDIATTEFVRGLYNISHNARIKEFKSIPECNHDFTGSDNSRVISKAPFWAFAEDNSFPSPDGGTILYD